MGNLEGTLKNERIKQEKKVEKFNKSLERLKKAVQKELDFIRESAADDSGEIFKYQCELFSFAKKIEDHQ